jgi:CheY-like chemotaxis protein
MVLLALTGYGQESDRGKALEAGFDAHFAKPPDLERIQDALYPGQRAWPAGLAD